MIKIARPFLAVSIVVLAATGLTACGGSSSSGASDCTAKFEFPTVTEGELTISTYDGMPYYGTDGDVATGMDVDFLNKFAADACLEPTWDVMPSAGVIQAVVSGRADIAAGGWYATEERGKTVSQSDASYVELPTIFSANGTDDVQDLQGKSVGTITGFTWVEDLKKLGMNLREYQSVDATLNDLAAGRIDYAVLGGIDAPYLLTQNTSYSDIQAKTMKPDPAVDSSVNPSLPNYPHTLGNTGLTEALNKQLDEYRSSGDLASSLEKYGLSADLAEVNR